jgi:hypothetical protein
MVALPLKREDLKLAIELQPHLEPGQDMSL